MIKLNRPECPNPAALDNHTYNDAQNKSALRDAAYGKCMYCESKIDHIAHAHVEHIKPKAPDKYPELAYEWSNLGYACPVCNVNKGDKYDSATPYIDPYHENPSDHLIFCGSILWKKMGSERGQLTIKDINLNRVNLVEKRRRAIEKFDSVISLAYRTNNDSLKKDAIAALKKVALPENEFSLCLSTFLKLQSE